MEEFIAALIAFVGSHLIISGAALRGRLVGLLGSVGFLLLYSVISLATFIWILHAYPEAYAQSAVLWTTPRGMEDSAVLVMLVVFLLLVLGLLQPKNPTSMTGGGQMDGDNRAIGIVRVTRHPVLSAVALWGLWHMMTSGHVAAVLLFGSMVLLSVLGMFSIDAKRAKVNPDQWEDFKRSTSRTPFWAILRGRNSFHFGEIGFWRILVGLIVFGAVLYFHQMLFGRSPLPGGMSFY